MRDLTERVLRELLETAPDAMVGVDESGIIVVTNAQTERLFGYSRDALLGQPVEMLVPDAAREIHRAHRAHSFTAPRARPMSAGMHLAGRRKDGTEFAAEISLSAVETDDRRLVSAAIRDITDRLAEQAEREPLAEAERERVQRQQTQSQRLESLGQLAGGVAHDFNNLLAVIVNYAIFAREAVAAAEAGDPPPDWTVVRSDIEQIEHAADRAARMTRRLLTFAHREVVRPEVLNLNHVVVGVEQLLRRAIGEHVTLRVSLAPALSNVIADAGQIEQVLVNLAINARDAMPRGGMLSIDTLDIAVDPDYVSGQPELEPGNYVRLRVSDDGTGMDKATLAHVFEPFFSTKAAGEGSGLGMATVYGIVTHAGGTVHIYSELGPGTTVSVLLPSTRQQLHAPEPVSRPLALGARGETVLVVEDEDAIRELTRRVLARNGYNVIVSAGGEDALAIAAGHPGTIDLLLTDVIMPEMLGREIAERVQKARPGIRVLFMSGYADVVLSSQGSLDPGFTLLEKPFTEAVLLEHVREVLDAPAPR